MTTTTTIEQLAGPRSYPGSPTPSLKLNTTPVVCRPGEFIIKVPGPHQTKDEEDLLSEVPPSSSPASSSSSSTLVVSPTSSTTLPDADSDSDSPDTGGVFVIKPARSPPTSPTSSSLSSSSSSSGPSSLPVTIPAARAKLVTKVTLPPATTIINLARTLAGWGPAQKKRDGKYLAFLRKRRREREINKLRFRQSRFFRLDMNSPLDPLVEEDEPQTNEEGISGSDDQDLPRDSTANNEAIPENCGNTNDQVSQLEFFPEFSESRSSTHVCCPLAEPGVEADAEGLMQRG
ncbi:hypothetical protein QBC35DRAFT_497582 [Podospora australis]|uniref:Uncharacterized protein n=1 Tax=Podospora australis TaxID=1536484 RepID=A0AAN6WTV7_9PEZI|nr:hypothetical protein QBC35DRAFT_497582 [Podospora australis]